MALQGADIKLIQEADSFLNNLIQKVRQSDSGEFKSFVLKNNSLFKIVTVLGERVLRLCLPSFLGVELIQKLHSSNNLHLSGGQLLAQFNMNFYVRNAEHIVANLKQTCLFCRLNSDRRKLHVKGTYRTFQDDLQLNKVWTADILYLPKSAEGYQYILTMAEKITSYITAIPLKILSTKRVSDAFRVFLGIFPAMSVLYTDHGKSDFSHRFTEMLAGYDIQHAGDIPRRSESQGAAELANKLLQNQLARICSSEDGRKAWEKSLPRAVQCLNQYHPYGSALSRCQLLFSPFIHLALGGVRGLSNPLSLQRFTFKQLNDRRVRGLLDKKAGTKLYNFCTGTICDYE